MAINDTNVNLKRKRDTIDVNVNREAKPNKEDRLKFGLSNSSLLLACKWTNTIAQSDYEKFDKKRKTETSYKKLWECYIEEDVKVVLSSGERNLKALVSMLKKADISGFRRSPQQVEFHRAFIAASLQKIMGDDLSRNLVRLMIEFELDEIRNDVVICTPRRWGKTYSVAIFAAAYIITQPNAEIAIYSTGRRASKKLLALIWTIVVKLVGNGVKRAYNQEMLKIKGTGSEPSVVYAYPSKEQIDRIIRLNRQVIELLFNINRIHTLLIHTHALFNVRYVYL